ncbi:MAG: hypothetical protein QMD00_04975 [Hadesarchaea archaeon]|nr:hypothetical protein [Hadesarchaea archaeon]
MREDDARLVRDSLSSVSPYIAYPQELKELIEGELKNSESVDVFIENVRRTISGRADVTRKTDAQIFLNELRRRIRK